jgi:hypothetical protein
MNNDTGIIYLLQPAELVGTNHYKIGCSKKNNLDRLKSYKIGTRYMDIRECGNPHDVETKVKDSFKIHLLSINSTILVFICSFSNILDITLFFDLEHLLFFKDQQISAITTL